MLPLHTRKTEHRRQAAAAQENNRQAAAEEKKRRRLPHAAAQLSLSCLPKAVVVQACYVEDDVHDVR
jgi:hypothetical protein